jgi:ArsR family transcriptional regulator
MKSKPDLPHLEREAQFLQALAHPIRLQILDFLSDEEKCVCEIEPHIDLDQSTISRHLQILKRAGVLASRKDGVRVFYQVRDPRVLKLRRQLAQLMMAQVRKDLSLLTLRQTAGVP